MKTRVAKFWLIKQLESNREKHRGIFLKAHEAYRHKAIALFEEQCDLARDRKPFRSVVMLTEPTDHTFDYDRVIGMVRNSSEETIELDEKDYRRFVQDDWEWTQQWKHTSNTYGVDPDA